MGLYGNFRRFKKEMDFTVSMRQTRAILNILSEL